MKLYFGNTVTAVTTIMILALLGFIGESIAKRTTSITGGRRSLFLLVYGLVICCFAAARDGLDKTIQNTIDGSCAPGVFPLISIPNLIGCVGAANYNHCSYCNTDSKVAAYEKDLVLCDVRRNYHEDTGNGNSKDC